MSRKSKYRATLARYIGCEIKLHCSQFHLMERGDDAVFLLLEAPTVARIAGRKRKNNWTFHHLWVRIPPDKIKYFKSYLPLARKLEIKGRVNRYEYQDGTPQAGVRATDIKILKYTKELAKKYNLNPGAQLSGKIMKQEMRKLASEN